jgi:aspartyl protease family protein
VSDVDAFVIDKGLETSLLGMSYLGRLEKFEATPDALVLRS